MNKLRHINGKTYRYGYTTGSCAAAAAKAAVSALLYGFETDLSQIETPAGITLNISVFGYRKDNETISCFVVKDSGDDPDITNGIEIHASARKNNEKSVIVEAGEGIGIVSQKGLQVEVGKPAINPAPMQMIVSEIKKILHKDEGVTVRISVPQGQEVAKRTFNERLGIVGGISILGTSGLVVPMSDEAFKESLALELSILREKGFSEVVFTPGNYGENFLETHFPQWTNRMVTTSNFIGYMLHEAVRNKFTHITLVGHIGKLVKVAGGIFHTHSSVADARREIFASHHFMYSKDAEAFRNIMNSNTTEEAIEFVNDFSFFNSLANSIKTQCEQHVHKQIKVDVVLFSLRHGLLGQTINNQSVA